MYVIWLALALLALVGLVRLHAYWMVATGVPAGGPLPPRDRYGRFMSRSARVPHACDSDLSPTELLGVSPRYEKKATPFIPPDDPTNTDALQLALRKWVLENLTTMVNNPRNSLWGVFNVLQRTWEVDQLAARVQAVAGRVGQASLPVKDSESATSGAPPVPGRHGVLSHDLSPKLAGGTPAPPVEIVLPRYSPPQPFNPCPDMAGDPFYEEYLDYTFGPNRPRNPAAQFDMRAELAAVEAWQDADLTVGVAPARPAFGSPAETEVDSQPRIEFAHQSSSMQSTVFASRSTEESRAGATPTVEGDESASRTGRAECPRSVSYQPTSPIASPGPRPQAPDPLSVAAWRRGVEMSPRPPPEATSERNLENLLSAPRM